MTMKDPLEERFDRIDERFYGLSELLSQVALRGLNGHEMDRYFAYLDNYIEEAEREAEGRIDNSYAGIVWQAKIFKMACEERRQENERLRGDSELYNHE